jgi:ABC-type Na+ transport system ATPase subunit NatA
LIIKIGKFSKGMKQKIGIASAIIHDPDIIV